MNYQLIHNEIQIEFQETTKDMRRTYNNEQGKTPYKQQNMASPVMNNKSEHVSRHMTSGCATETTRNTCWDIQQSVLAEVAGSAR